MSSPLSASPHGMSPLVGEHGERRQRDHFRSGVVANHPRKGANPRAAFVGGFAEPTGIPRIPPSFHPTGACQDSLLDQFKHQFVFHLPHVAPSKVAANSRWQP